jgi:aerobic-type carbon monoxide dehydrogenase small subunit (CoxS/CutS family)
MRFTVNGRGREVAAPAAESLATTLRDRLFLTGTKIACDRGECGACTVLLDGETVYSCITLTAACEGREIVTVEGLGARHGATAADARGATPAPLHPVQQAFIDCDAVQCGFCTPGQVISAVALLERTPAPDDTQIAEAMSGNLCRCGTYPKIAQAIRQAAARMTAGAQAPR